VRTDSLECLWTNLVAVIVANGRSQRRFLNINRDIYDFVITVNDLKSRQDDPKHGLLHLAQTFRDQQATDEHDKLFALTGLIKNPTSLTIQLDYTEREAIVFVRFMLECINRSGNFVVLALSEQSRESLGNPWVTNWSTDKKTRYRVSLWAGDILSTLISLESYWADGGNAV
jgi:hypothetical protein